MKYTPNSFKVGGTLSALSVIAVLSVIAYRKARAKGN